MKYIKVFDTAEAAVNNYRNADEKAVSAIQIEIDGTTYTFNYESDYFDDQNRHFSYHWTNSETDQHAITSVRNPGVGDYCIIFTELS